MYIDSNDTAEIQPNDDPGEEMNVHRRGNRAGFYESRFRG